MKELELKLVEACKAFIADAEGKPTKAAHKRMRRNTLLIGKLGKEYRKLSIAADSE